MKIPLELHNRSNPLQKLESGRRQVEQLLPVSNDGGRHPKFLFYFKKFYNNKNDLRQCKI
jgi:hypothetical protein